ncbi:hypothetical protein VOLCADRAFT_90892 [Volvox carteri f. nagariensis]|uniref:Glycerophosphocholine acyltransferase 1 n=1 Tax=Volvox carteri f. nagariensis TaxID=3068 RepID=D8TVC3_VOLCA|nr:uncharacterized protein VOLCADRAFT_90892 [Volvox carteri f. nagariensis]EFJ48676.1 hypothetical protein VOLCADRAFT_90892 [Volvox carteri f. nagariensis]|eukprot:XP_002950475.1 hypothetical protein VOLCADRAFT_90892 [Volvox carteri f. nagariensis]
MSHALEVHLGLPRRRRRRGPRSPPPIPAVQRLGARTSPPVQPPMSLTAAPPPKPQPPGRRRPATSRLWRRDPYRSQSYCNLAPIPIQRVTAVRHRRRQPTVLPPPQPPQPPPPQLPPQLPRTPLPRPSGVPRVTVWCSAAGLAAPGGTGGDGDEGVPLGSNAADRPAAAGEDAEEDEEEYDDALELGLDSDLSDLRLDLEFGLGLIDARDSFASAGGAVPGVVEDAEAAAAAAEAEEAEAKSTEGGDGMEWLPVRKPSSAGRGGGGGAAAAATAAAAAAANEAEQRGVDALLACLSVSAGGRPAVLAEAMVDMHGGLHDLPRQLHDLQEQRKEAQATPLKRRQYDFCYYANLLLVLQLWILPRCATLAKVVTFSYNTGPLAWSILTFRNSLVFHDLDKVTSLFLHLVPALVSWSLRWHGDPGRFGPPGEATPEERARWHSAGFGPNVLLPMVFYVAWALAYYLKIFVFSRAKIQQRGYRTLFNYVTTQKKPPVYLFLHLCFCATTFAVAMLCWHSFWAHTALLAAVASASIWHGGSYYFEVFARRYHEQLLPSASPRKEA